MKYIVNKIKYKSQVIGSSPDICVCFCVCLCYTNFQESGLPLILERNNFSGELNGGQTTFINQVTLNYKSSEVTFTNLTVNSFKIKPFIN